MEAAHHNSAQHLSRRGLNSFFSFLKYDLPLILFVSTQKKQPCSLLDKTKEFFKESHVIVHVEASDTLKPKGLLHKLHVAASIPPPNPRLRFEDQIKYFVDHTGGKKLLLAVSGANQLTYSVLAALSHLALLQEKTMPSIQTLLLGTEALITKMQSIQARPLHALQIEKNNRAAMQRLDDLIQQNQSTFRTKASALLLTAMSPPDPIHAGSHSKHTTFLFRQIWNQHQVRILSASGLLVLSLSMLHFSHEKPYRPPIGLLAYNRQSSAIPIQKLATSQAPPRPIQTHYSIQLASTKSKEAAMQFIKKQHLESVAHLHHKANYYQITIDGFTGFSAAKSALAALPAALKRKKPWIKKSFA